MSIKKKHLKRLISIIERDLDNLQRRVYMLECGHKHTVTVGGSIGGLYHEKCACCGKHIRVMDSDEKDKHRIKELQSELKSIRAKIKARMEDS